MTKQAKTKLPQDLTELLFSRAGRTVVLVEGETDQYVFDDWFPEHLKSLFFSQVGGGGRIDNWLEELAQLGVPVFAVIDRDFRTAEEVEASLNDPNSRRFILSRYEIENYFLDAPVVWETLSKVFRERFEVPTPEAMQGEIVELCHRLKTLAAANWLLWETGKVEEEERLSVEHEVEREAILGRLFKMLACAPEEAEANLAAKEAHIETSLSETASLHTFIRGKSLVHHLHRDFIKNAHPRESLGKTYFINFLIDRIGLTKRIPADIRFIVEQKILGLPAQPGT
jgi:hypothetical protein